ncbi:MAG TPA: ribokinase [Urbifossiella sp.]|nr:ribokinase [Urbifossiella sp.]
MNRPRVCVVGSSNLDMNAYVERLPLAGETRTGQRFTTGYGGKGANQAVMAARLGAEVRFIGRVGDDIFGRDMLANFQNEGIDTTHVLVTESTSSGVAIITVDTVGRNSIVVIPGANGHLTAADVGAARAAIETAQVLVCQMEVPLEANLAALRIAVEAGIPVIFNPAPAPTTLPQEVYRSSTVLCVNETEAARLAGREVQSIEDAEIVTHLFQERGAKNVIVTFGSSGCLLATANGTVHIPAPQVLAVDTTGAGDAFLGSLAVDLAGGLDLAAAADRACRIAAITVQSAGAQTSFPRRTDLPD